LIADPARLRALGDAGRKSVFDRYTDDAMARDIHRAVLDLR
jgi:hypothetical protein